MSDVPRQLRYTEDHLWLQRLDDGGIRVGITDFAQQQLGDVVYVDLPSPGQTCAEKVDCAVVESVKSASDIPCPLSGRVTSVNDALEDSPETVNQDCYGAGWLFVMEADDPEDLAATLDADGYALFISARE